MMRTLRVTAVVLGILLLSGCGDQVWCGENGCAGQKGGNITSGQTALVTAAYNLFH